MDDKDYELLILLSKTNNITHTAEQLYISQSTLSKRIRSIEKELSTELLIRSRQGVHFTPAGEVVLKHAQAIMEHKEQMTRDIDSLKNIVSGTIKLGVSVNFAHYKLPQFLKSFKNQYPLVATHIHTNQSRDLYKLLLKNTLDAAILRGDFQDWTGNKLFLYRERICLIYNNEIQSLSDLNNLPYITRETDTNMEHAVIRWLNENNLSQNIKSDITVDGIQTVVNMVKENLGWAIVPEICLENFTGTVKPLFFNDGMPLERSTYLLYQPNLKVLPQIDAFIQFMTDWKEAFHE